MRTSKKGSDWSQLWKRNAVVAAIALFVCAAVYLNWNYGKEGTADAGKTLGQSTMVGGKTQDPLVSGDGSAPASGTAGEDAGDTSAAGEAGDVQTPSETGGAYFATARLNRQQARDSALSLLQDAAEGNVPGYDLLRESSEGYSQLGMELEYRSWKRDGYIHTYKRIEVYPTMTHTLEKLMELGYVTEAEISQWNQEMGLEDDGPIPADMVVQPGK